MKKSKTITLISITCLLAICFALIFPLVILESQSANPNAIGYVFGATSTFGGHAKLVGSSAKVLLNFNVGGFVTFMLMVAALLLVFFFGEKQVSSLVISALILVASGVLLFFSKNFVDAANGDITGFTAFERTGFGSYVSAGLCFLGAIECFTNLYIIHADRARNRIKRRR